MPKKTTHVAPTYSDLSQQLDEIVSKLQDPNVAIDDASKYYENAMELVKQLEKHLEQAENRIQKIQARFSEDK